MSARPQGERHAMPPPDPRVRRPSHARTLSAALHDLAELLEALAAMPELDGVDKHDR
jgi:hypothetical protein